MPPTVEGADSRVFTMFGLTNLVAHVLINMILPDIFPSSSSIAALQSKTIKQQQRKEKGGSCECQGLRLRIVNPALYCTQCLFEIHRNSRLCETSMAE